MYARVMDYTHVSSLGFLKICMLRKYVCILRYYSSKIRSTSNHKHTYVYNLVNDFINSNFCAGTLSQMEFIGVNASIDMAKMKVYSWFKFYGTSNKLISNNPSGFPTFTLSSVSY
jgi:hypothetical protein